MVRICFLMFVATFSIFCLPGCATWGEAIEARWETKWKPAVKAEMRADVAALVKAGGDAAYAEVQALFAKGEAAVGAAVKAAQNKPEAERTTVEKLLAGLAGVGSAGGIFSMLKTGNRTLQERIAQMAVAAIQKAANGDGGGGPPLPVLPNAPVVQKA